MSKRKIEIEVKLISENEASFTKVVEEYSSSDLFRVNFRSNESNRIGNYRDPFSASHSDDHELIDCGLKSFIDSIYESEDVASIDFEDSKITLVKWSYGVWDEITPNVIDSIEVCLDAEVQVVEHETGGSKFLLMFKQLYARYI